MLRNPINKQWHQLWTFDQFAKAKDVGKANILALNVRQARNGPFKIILGIVDFSLFILSHRQGYLITPDRLRCWKQRNISTSSSVEL